MVIQLPLFHCVCVCVCLSLSLSVSLLQGLYRHTRTPLLSCCSVQFFNVSFFKLNVGIPTSTSSALLVSDIRKVEARTMDYMTAGVEHSIVLFLMKCGECDETRVTFMYMYIHTHGSTYTHIHILLDLPVVVPWSNPTFL
jgi:hypothetical protein